GNDPLAVELATHPLAGQLGILATQIDGEHVVRYGIERPLIGARTLARRTNQRLVVSGDRVHGRPARGHDGPRLQPALQELAYGFRTRGIRRPGRIECRDAHVPPRSGRDDRAAGTRAHATLHDGLAIAQEAVPDDGVVAGLPG